MLEKIGFILGKLWAFCTSRSQKWAILFALLIIISIWILKDTNSSAKSSDDYKTEFQDIAINETDVNICKCLTEPGNSEYMTQNGTFCDKAISKEIGVADWRKVNMKYDKVTSKKFDELVYKCTEQQPNIEISGIYSGIDNVGMKSTIILQSGGTLIIQGSVGEGTSDYGNWTGTADNLSLYHKDFYGNEELIGKAEVTNYGLKIKGGKFYSRQ